MECKGYICVVRRTGEEGSRCPVMDEYVIGTALNCDIRINLSTIAKQHCKIYVDESGQAFLQNLTKNYSTLLNGSALQFRQKKKLNHKDLITVAERSFCWEYLPSSAFYSLKKQSVTPLKSNLMDPPTSVKFTPDPCHINVKISREEFVLAENVSEKIRNSTTVNKDYRHSLQAIEMLKTQSSPRPRRSCVPKFVVCDSNLDNNLDASRARMKWQVTPQSARRFSVTNLKDSDRKRGECLLKKSILNSIKMSTPHDVHSKLKSLSEINRKSDAIETVNKGPSLLNVGVTPNSNKKKMVAEDSLESLQKSAKRLKLSTTDNGTSSAVKQCRPLFSEVAKRIMKNKKSTPVRSSTVKTNRDKIQIKVVQSKPKVLSAIPKKFTTNSTGHAESPETIIIRKKLGTSRNTTELKYVIRESRKSATKNIFPEKQNLTPGKITSASRLGVNPLNSAVKIASPDIYTPAASASKSKRCLQVNSLLKRADIEVTPKSRNLVNSSSIVKTTSSGGQTNQSTSEESLSRPHDELSQDLSTLKKKSLRKTPLRMENLARGSSKNLGRKLSLNLTPYKRRTKSVSAFEERRLSENITPLQDLHFSKRSSVHEDEDSPVTLKESSDLAKKQNSPQGSIENPRHVCVSNVERQNASFSSPAQVDSPLKRKKKSFIATTSKNLSPNRDSSSSHEVVQMNVDVGFNMDATNSSSEKGLMKIRIETDDSAESGTDIQIFNGFQRSHSSSSSHSSQDLADEIYMEKQIKPSRAQKSPRNDLTNVRGVKKLLGTPKVHKSPKNDLTVVSGIKKLLRTPKVQKSPINELTDVRGIKKLLRTPKVQKSPRNDLTDVKGVKKLLRTPKEQKSPINDLTNVRGVKKFFGTPKVHKSPKNDLTDVRGIKKLLRTPKEQKSPINDLTDVRGIKKLLRTPKVQKSPRNDLTDVRGIKKLLRTPKVQKSPRNDLTDLRGIKKLLRTPKEQKSPINDLTDVRGVKKLLGTPKEQKSPINDLTDVRGIKKLLRTPKVQKSPRNDLTDVRGVKKLLRTPKEQKSPINDLTDVRGVKKLLGTPKEQKSPINDLTDVRGIKKLLRTPKVQKSPRNDLTDLRGIKKLLRTPKEQKSPKNDLTDVRGVKKLLGTPKEQKSPINDLTDVRGVKKLLRTPKEQMSPNNNLMNVEGVKELYASPDNQIAYINELSKTNGLDTLFRSTRATSIKNFKNLTELPLCFDNNGNQNLRTISTGIDHFLPEKSRRKAKVLKSDENPCNNNNKTIATTSTKSVEELTPKPRPKKRLYNSENEPSVSSPRKRTRAAINSESQNQILHQEAILVIQDINGMPFIPKSDTQAETSCSKEQLEGKTIVDDHLAGVTGQKQKKEPKRVHNSPRIVATDLGSIKKVLKTPKLQKSPKNGLMSIRACIDERTNMSSQERLYDKYVTPVKPRSPPQESPITNVESSTELPLFFIKKDEQNFQTMPTTGVELPTPEKPRRRGRVLIDASPYNNPTDSKSVKGLPPISDIKCIPSQRVTRGVLRHVEDVPNPEHGTKALSKRTRKQTVTKPVLEGSNTNDTNITAPKTRHVKSKVAANTSKTRKGSSDSSKIDVPVPEEMLQDAASTPPQKTRRAKRKVAPNTSKTRKESSGSSKIEVSVPEEMLQDAASTISQRTRRAKSKIAANTSKTRKGSSDSSKIDVPVPEEMLQDAASTPPQKTRRAKSKVAPNTSKTRKESSGSSKIEVSVPKEILQDATNISSPILDKSTDISKSSPIRVTRRFRNKTSTTQNTESNLPCLSNVVSEFSPKRRTRSQKSTEASSKNHNSNSEGVKASTGSLGKISNKKTAKKHYQEKTTIDTDTSRGTRTCKIKNTIDSEVTRRTRRRV